MTRKRTAVLLIAAAVLTNLGFTAAVVQVIGLSRWPLLVPARRVAPLDLGAIDTVNFAGYVLWSVWLVWLAVVLLRTRPDPVDASSSANLAGVRS
jgi:hypothetical protein